MKFDDHPPEIAEWLRENCADGIVLTQALWPATEGLPGCWFGGNPTMPKNVMWPRNPKTGLPLHFLAQLDLGKLPKIENDCGLPSMGTLFFFFDVAEEFDSVLNRGETRVVYVPDDLSATPERAFPIDIPRFAHANHAADGKYAEQVHGAVKWPLTAKIVDTFHLSQTDFHGYYDPSSEITEQQIGGFDPAINKDLCSPHGQINQLLDGGFPWSKAFCELLLIQVIRRLRKVQAREHEPTWKIRQEWRAKGAIELISHGWRPKGLFPKKEVQRRKVEFEKVMAESTKAQAKVNEVRSEIQSDLEEAAGLYQRLLYQNVPADLDSFFTDFREWVFPAGRARNLNNGWGGDNIFSLVVETLSYTALTNSDAMIMRASIPEAFVQWGARKLAFGLERPSNGMFLGGWHERSNRPDFMEDWIRLLELPPLEPMIGSGSGIEYWISKEDLKAQNFSNCFATYDLQ